VGAPYSECRKGRHRIDKAYKVAVSPSQPQAAVRLTIKAARETVNGQHRVLELVGGLC
jgi:hypothetical protein